MVRAPLISIESELDAVAPFFRILAKDQLPFAASKAGNRSAVKSRDKVREAQRERFKLRNRGILKGVQATFSNKRDWPRLVNIVGSRDEFQELQETGGTKRSARGRLAVPRRQIEKRRRKSGRAAGTFPKSLQPRLLLQRKNVFVQELPGGRGYIRRKRGAVKLLFLLVKQATVRPAEPTIEQAAVPAYTDAYPGELVESLEQAVATSRRRAKRRT